MEDDHGVFEGLRGAKLLRRDALEHLPHKLPKNSLQMKRRPSQLEARGKHQEETVDSVGVRNHVSEVENRYQGEGMQQLSVRLRQVL